MKRGPGSNNLEVNSLGPRTRGPVRFLAANYKMLANSQLRRQGDGMLAIAIVAAAAGLVLGLRFNATALVLLVLATTIVFAVGVWGGSHAVIVALQLLATLASVQISYLVGCLLAAHLPARAKTRVTD